MTSVLNTIVAATTRTPHAVKLSPEEDRYVRRRSAQHKTNGMIDPNDMRPQSAQTGKSSEALEHDTLTRIRDALYRDQQA